MKQSWPIRNEVTVHAWEKPTMVGSIQITPGGRVGTPGICLGICAVWISDAVSTGRPPTTINMPRASLLQAYTKASSLPRACEATGLAIKYSVTDCQSSTLGVLANLAQLEPDSYAFVGLCKLDPDDCTGHMMAAARTADGWWFVDPNHAINLYPTELEFKIGAMEFLSLYDDMPRLDLAIVGG